MAKVTINKNACKGCGMCVIACPKNILAISSTESNDKGYFIVEMTDADKCIGCAACAIMCPDCALEVER